MTGDAPQNRVFLGWDRPLVDLTAERLLAAAPDADLGDVLVAVPSRRARRLLLATLVGAVDARDRVLIPPAIVTVGRLPERLLGRVPAVASPLARDLAWRVALAENPKARAAVFPHLGDEADSEPLSTAALRDSAAALERLERALVGAGLAAATVAERLAQADMLPPEVVDTELARWQGGVAPLAAAFAATLAAAGLADADRVWLARAAAGDVALRMPRRVVVVGSVELNALQRAALAAAAKHVCVDVWVHAPASQATRFDDWGCVRAEAWTKPGALAELMPKAHDVHAVDDPEAAATVAVALLAARAADAPLDAVALGIADPTAAPYVRERLRCAGIAGRDAAGTALGRTRPLQLLAVLGDWLDGGDLDALAALVRHVDVEVAPGMPPQPVLLVDRYHAEHRDARDSDGRRLPPLTDLEKGLDALLAPFGDTPAPPAAWAERIAALLTRLQPQPLQPTVRAADHDMAEALTLVGAALRELATLPETLWRRVPGAAPGSAGVAPGTALRWLHARLEGETIPPPRSEGVELLGWLELHWESAPHLVVLGMNEGSVPAGIREDVFLPNGARTRLGLVDDRARLARDAYVLAALTASRASSPPQWLVLRRGAQGDPLRPSRLWFLAASAQNREMAARIVTAPTLRVAAPAAETSAGGAAPIYHPPLPVPPEPPLQRLSPTGFRTYLTCPYRFYLQHVLHLQTVDDSAHELDALNFGNLLHSILHRAWLQDTTAFHSGDAVATEALFAAMLATVARERYGARPDSLVRLQIEQARRRLRRLAIVQAREAAAGWRTLVAEVEFGRDDEVALCRVGAGKTFTIHGKIDRIDRHQPTGAFRLLDYKSGDRARTPMATHQVYAGDWRRGWCDLQLPLYNYAFGATPLGASLGWDGVAAVDLGYINIAADAGRDAGLSLADWDAAALDDALGWARAVARRVYRGCFAELAADTTGSGALADICLELQAARVTGLQPFDRDAIAVEVATEGGA